MGEPTPTRGWHTRRRHDLAETARLVEATGHGIVASQGDVRDLSSLQSAVQEGLDKFGHIDIVSANAGISPFGPVTWDNDGRQWNDVYEVNLLGCATPVWPSCPR